MQEKINKGIWLIVAFLLLGLIGNIVYMNWFQKNQKIAFESKIYYMDTYIYLKVYTEDEEKANEALEEAQKIYKKYHELTDRYHGYPGLKNIYYIYHNNEESEYLEIDERLYDILTLASTWYQKSDGLFDVRIGSLIDLWKNSKETESIPNSSDLEQIQITDLVLKDGKILNNHPNLDLGGIAKGYATKKVGEYFESIGMNVYLINAGGNVLVGEHYDNDAYKIGLEDPTKNDASIFMKVKANHMAVVTSGGYERFFEVEGKRYHHIINPKTRYPSDECLSVTVIAEDSALADILSTVFFLMEVEDALELVNSMDGVEAIFYLSEEEQIMSEGFEKYLYE